MKKVIIGLVLALVVLLFFSGYFWLYEAKYFIGRASVSQASFSMDNSYVFVSPLKAAANNLDKIRVTVFILNNQGLGVLGKTVELGSDPSLSIETTQALTDNYGKALFDISSNKVGEYYLEVKVDQTVLPQKAHLTFD